MKGIRDKPETWGGACKPNTYKSIIRWFEMGWIKEGDYDRPYRMFHPSDAFRNAVVIYDQLRYQECPS